MAPGLVPMPGGLVIGGLVPRFGVTVFGCAVKVRGALVAAPVDFPGFGVAVFLGVAAGVVLRAGGLAAAEPRAGIFR